MDDRAAPSRRLTGTVSGLVLGLVAAVLLSIGLASCTGDGEGGNAASTTTTTPVTERGFVRHHWVSTEPVDGAAGVRARVSTSLVFPETWSTDADSGDGRDEGLVLREGHGDCFYDVRARSRVVARDGTTAAALAEGSAPATGRYLLEEGRRDPVVWRVTRVAESGRFHVRAVRVEPLVGASARQGVDLYLETTVDGRSEPGGECHSGTWRDVLGPAVGDALATARTRTVVPAS